MITRTLASFCTVLTLAAPAMGQGTYNRIAATDDIAIMQSPVPGGGWVITARGYLSNQSGSPVDLSSTLTISVNGSPVASGSLQAIVASNGGGICVSSCASDAGCVTCKPSVIPGLPCHCCTHAIDTTALVASLKPGDVVAAAMTAAPGAAPELVTQDDWGFKVIPPHVRYNRVMDPSSLKYERSPDVAGGYRVSGHVTHQVTYGDSGDLSSRVLVSVGGTTYSGGGGGTGGGGGGSENRIYFAGAMPIGIALFDCSYFCTGCTGYDINICNPPSVSGSPLCSCQQFCVGMVVAPGGFNWWVDLPPQAGDAMATVSLEALPGSLPEIDSTDDTVVARIRDITPCAADLGSQGGLPTHDGHLDNNDFVVFIDLFFNGDARADFGRQGGLPGSDSHFDNNDFVVFIDRFFAGCS